MKIYIAYLKILFCVIVWGASFVATKVALQGGIRPLSSEIGSQISPTKVALRDVSPVTVVWLRFAMGVVILGAAVLLRRQFALPRRNEMAYFTLLGFLGITFHQWLQSTGLVTAQATTTAWIVASTPVFIALLGWLVLKERLGKWGMIGIGLAALGVLVVVSRGDWNQIAAGHIGSSGDVLILISAPNWALFSVLSRKGLAQHPAARMMFYVMAIGWLFSSLLFLRGSGLQEIPQLTRDGWLGVGFLGIFCSGLAYIFWYDGLQALPASQVGAFLYFEPLVTVIVAAIVLGEPLLAATLLGGGLILWGVWLVNRRQLA